jgi:hypothetical protein
MYSIDEILYVCLTATEGARKSWLLLLDERAYPGG